MISIDVLLDMVATEAIEGGSRCHYFDESRNQEFILPEPRYEQPKTKTKLPLLEYDLRLIERPDGSYEWVE